MAHIAAPVLRNGDVIPSADLDNFLDSLATQTASQTIAGDNLRRECIGIHNITTNFSTIFHGRVDYDGAADYTITTTPTVPNAGGSSMAVTTGGVAITAGDVIKVRCGMLTGVPTVGAPTLDEYYFIIRMQHSGGNPTLGPTRVFSMQAHKDSTVTTASLLNYTRPQISWDYVYTGADVTFNTLDILAAVRSASNSIPIESWHLYCSVVRR